MNSKPDKLLRKESRLNFVLFVLDLMPRLYVRARYAMIKFIYALELFYWYLNQNKSNFTRRYDEMNPILIKNYFNVDGVFEMIRSFSLLELIICKKCFLWVKKKLYIKDQMKSFFWICFIPELNVFIWYIYRSHKRHFFHSKVLLWALVRVPKRF